MALQYDPEYNKQIEPLLPFLAKRECLTVDNVVSSRKSRDAGVAVLLNKLPDGPDVNQTIHYAVAPDGHKVPILALVRKQEKATSDLISASTLTRLGPALLHFHGGGMVMGSAQMYARSLCALVSETSIPIFTVDYRLAPEHTGSTLVEDCYAALLWLRENAEKRFTVDPARIALYGQSAGGGLAAGVALMARDQNLQPPLAKQILVYPMLDDRTQTVNQAIEPLAFWKTADNVVAWECVLGADKSGRPDADVSPYVAPARAVSVAGLPSTYIDVGALDIFRDEAVAYAVRLLAENVETELHVYAGIPHAFEVIAPNISATKRADGNRLRAFLSF